MPVDKSNNNSASDFAGIKRARFRLSVVSSDLPEQHKSDDDDQDGADNTDTAVAVAETVAAKTAAQAAEQKHNEDDNDDDPYRHGLISVSIDGAYAYCALATVQNGSGVGKEATLV